MNRLLKLPSFLLLTAGTVLAQGYVTNAIGSLSSRQNTIAPAMLATLNASVPYYAAPGSQYRVLLRPAGTNQTLSPSIVSQDSSGITFVVPAGIPQGSAELLWQYGDQPFQAINVIVAANNFELSGKFTGPSGQVGLATPAQPGQTISLSGSGLGYGTQVTATVAGLTAPVIYAGRGATAGHDLIQLQIPTGVADSCYEPLVLGVGASTVTSAISVTATGAPCRHPLGLALTDLKNLDAGSSLNVAQIVMSTGISAPLTSTASRNEGISFQYFPLTPAQLAQQFIPATPMSCGPVGPVSAVFSVLGDFANSVSLGSSLILTGPSNKFTATAALNQPPSYQFVLPSPQDAPLGSLPVQAIAGGKWSLTTSGSPYLPAASFGFTLPSPVQLTGAAPVVFRRDQDQTIFWNGSGFDSGAIARVWVSGHGTNGVSSNIVSCAVSAHAGTLTLPQSLLAAFAPASLGTLTLTVTPGPAAVPGAAFGASDGTPVAFLVVWSSTDNRPVDFQ